MAYTNYYYVYPFGQNADDLTSIPTSAAGDGSVSYYAGWTDPYEYDLLTNPSALPIPRGQMNQLFYDITYNIQEYQQLGTPQWITSSQNLGTPYPYPIYARVYYNNVVYENQNANNTVTPGTDNSWLPISGNAQGVPTGAVIDYASPYAPSGYLTCDGSAYNRLTYFNLYKAITFQKTGTLNNTTTITGLSPADATTSMYVGMPLEGTGIPTGATVAVINSNSSITISAAATATGSQTLTFFPWFNGDNSTTFNIPDFRRYTSIGMGGTGTFGAVVGQDGGAETVTLTSDQLANHSHTASTSITASGNTTNINVVRTDASTISPTGNVYVPGLNGVSGISSWFTSASFLASTTVNAVAGNNAHNNMQPSIVMNKAIKT